MDSDVEGRAFQRTKRFMEAMVRSHDARPPGAPDPQALRHENFLSRLLDRGTSPGEHTPG